MGETLRQKFNKTLKARELQFLLEEGFSSLGVLVAFVL